MSEVLHLHEVCVFQLDLYNQRLLERREQQYKEMLASRKQGERNKNSSLIPPGIITHLHSCSVLNYREVRNMNES